MNYDALLQQVSDCRRLLVYGLSDATGAFLREAAGLPVVGLLDGFQVSGEMYGLPIVPIEEAPRLGVGAIVIVARAASVRIVARRIEAFCRAQGIRLFDVAGRDLLAQAQVVSCDYPYFSLTMDDLRAAIDAHEVISFDIFDTLIMRRVPEPEDVFALLERERGIIGFAQARLRVEHALYHGGRQPRLREIYTALSSVLGWSAEEAAQGAQAELALERRLLVPRPGMAEALSYAKAQGKTVCLLSDMYVPSAWLADVLAACGITGQDALFVSCEAGRSKAQGLFETCKAQFPAASYLHVGDNEEADGQAARAHGFDAFHVARATELAALSTWRTVFGAAETLPEKLLAGALLVRLFGDPFALAQSGGRLRLQDGRALGFAIFGPLMVAFFYWVVRQARGRQDVVLWGARDGYLFEKMHRALLAALPEAQRAALPRGVYFYTSRMASLPAMVRTEADIRALARIGFDGTPEELLQKRFHLPAENVLPQEEGETQEAYLLRHAPQILTRAKELRARMEKYLKRLGLSDKRLAFVDLVSSGSCHLAAEALFGETIAGYYLVHIHVDSPRKAALSCQAYLEDGRLLELHTQLARNYEPLETITMSGEPTLAGFDAAGQPVFGREPRTAEDLRYLREVQEGVMELFEMTLLQATCFLSDEVRPSFVDALYGCLCAERTRILNCPLADAVVSDDFTNRTFQMKDMFD